MASKNRNLQELDSGRAEFIPPCFSFGELDRSQGTENYPLSPAGSCLLSFLFS